MHAIGMRRLGSLIALVVLLAMPMARADDRPRMSDLLQSGRPLPIQAIMSGDIVFDVIPKPGLARSGYRLSQRRINVRAFGARGDGRSNDGPAILRALAAAPAGSVVWFDPGVYRYGSVLSVTTAGVVLSGERATLFAADPDAAAIQLRADRAAIVGLTLAGAPPGDRGSFLPQHRVVATGRGNRILSNSILTGKAGGIFLYGASDYVVAGNLVRATRADGIHSTHGARDGYVVANRVIGVEDDGISVVSYSPVRKARRIIVERNHIGHLRWGRGVGIVGSDDIVVRGNRVTRIAAAAGILVASEPAYETPGSWRAKVFDNRISDIQFSLRPLPGHRRTGHAAIEINGEGSGPDRRIQGVEISGNRVTASRFGGTRLLGGVCTTTLTNNAFDRVAGAPILVAEPLCARPIALCRENSHAGRRWTGETGTATAICR